MCFYSPIYHTSRVRQDTIIPLKINVFSRYTATYSDGLSRRYARRTFQNAHTAHAVKGCWNPQRTTDTHALDHRQPRHQVSHTMIRNTQCLSEDGVIEARHKNGTNGGSFCFAAPLPTTGLFAPTTASLAKASNASPPPPPPSVPCKFDLLLLSKPTAASAGKVHAVRSRNR
jgi:hypothetical protein